MEKIFNWGTTVSKEELIEKINELSNIVLDNTKKPRDPEYKKVLLKSLEEEKRARDKFDQSYTKIVTIRLKLSEVREVLDRKRNHQSILRRI